jgi:hypothetical protein
MQEISKKEILSMNIESLYIEMESIKDLLLGIPIEIENPDRQTITKIEIDFEIRNDIFNKIKNGFTISINIIDIIKMKYTEKWKTGKVIFGNYNNRKECDYYKFQEEIIKRKALMVKIINAYYNYKEKAVY